MRKRHSLIYLTVLAIAVVLFSVSWTFKIQNQNTKPNISEHDSTPAIAEDVLDQYINSLYQKTGLAASGLSSAVFKDAITGYVNFKNKNLLSSAKDIITIVDFTKSSREKRLWIVDLAKEKLLFNTLVAHGQGSGDDMAQYFSNISESHQSSLGFYITGNTYQGKHGLSLKLDGMDTGFNTNANNRAIVLHGAEYVSQSFINQHGRLGRSHGCPAVPVELNNAIIDVVKNKTCLFINGNNKSYNSVFLNHDSAVSSFTLKPANTLQASI